MNFKITCLFSLAMAFQGWAEEAPAVFAGILKKDIPYVGEIGLIAPPPEIQKYVQKVEASAAKDPEWFKKYSEAGPSGESGSPLPYHEKLGITQEEYNDYQKLWKQRSFQGLEKVAIILRETASGQWIITATGNAGVVSTLRYTPKGDLFKSPNGDLKRIADIKATDTSLLGAWSGKEWRLEGDTGFGKLAENIGLGKDCTGKFGMLLYRIQESDSSGAKTMDKSLFVRFALNQTLPKAPEKAAEKAPELKK